MANLSQGHTHLDTGPRSNLARETSLGLRYEVFQPPHGGGYIFNYDPLSNTLVKDDLPVGIDWKSFGPRIGFADSLLPNTVLRGGFGISYIPALKGLGSEFTEAPLRQINNFSATDSFTPAITFQQDFGQFNTSLSMPVAVTPTLGVSLIEPEMLVNQSVMSWNLTLERQLGNNVKVSCPFDKPA
jgi:hypothetical protein